MRTKYALLAIILIQTLCASVVGARGSAITGRASLTAGTTFPCTLDVVLVTFRDATTQASGTIYDYHNHDRPYGSNPDQDMRDRYTLREFERLFSGGYGSLQDSAFVGNTVRVAKGRHTLPEVFGSVRAYYDSVSNGAFQLHVRMINPADDQGYPHWIELPETKAHYAEIEIDDGTARPDDRTRTIGNWFWDDAYTAAQAAVDVWYPDTDEYDLPNDSYDTARRLRHKVLYLYSGATYTARSPAGLLHPHVDEITADNPTVGDPQGVGYRYVMGEREGWGDNDHDIDEFAGIFTHAHEIGHLLGLVHPGGQWRNPNPYTEAVLDTNYNAANLMDWGLMQGSGAGPQVTDRSNARRLYHRAYRSCPNPINPFYRMDLGWLTPTNITESRGNYVIEPGTVHRVTRPTNRGLQVEYLLERRSHDGMERMEDGEVVGGRSFGRYVSYHEYDDTDPGLFIWRRHSNRERPMLIVADERRFRNARDRDHSPRIHEYQDMLYDPFPVTEDRVRVLNATRFIQSAVNSVDSHTAGSGLRQTTRHGTRDGGRQPDPGDVRLAITQIERTDEDRITVDIYMAPPGPPTHVTAVMTNEQATLSWHRPAPTDSGPQPPPPSYEYRQSTNGGGTWEDAIAVAEASTDARSQTVVLVPDTDYLFEVRAVNPLGSSDWVRPFVLEGPSAITEFPEVVAPEAERRIVARYTATDPEGDMVEWSLAGTDADDFALSSDGQLTFRLDPNFEEPTDRNHPPDQEPPTDRAENNIYHLIVQSRAGQQSAMLDVAVTVTDADDPGVISLSPPSPQVRMPLTAELTDEDGGILDARWQWQGQAPEATAWQPLSGTSSAGNQSSYTPPAAQVGWMLQAVVNPYRDALDEGKRAESMATEPVQAGVPDAPVLDALERNGRVSLIVRLGADNGSEITRTETRVYSVSQDTTWRTTKGQWHSRSIDPTSWIYPSLFTSGQPVG